MPRVSTIRCASCGIHEAAELIDAKPSDGDWECGDYDLMQCVNCYGPGYRLMSPDHIRLSIIPHWRPAYLCAIASQVLRDHSSIVWC